MPFAVRCCWARRCCACCAVRGVLTLSCAPSWPAVLTAVPLSCGPAGKQVRHENADGKYVAGWWVWIWLFDEIARWLLLDCRALPWPVPVPITSVRPHLNRWYVWQQGRCTSLAATESHTQQSCCCTSVSTGYSTYCIFREVNLYRQLEIVFSSSHGGTSS